MTYIIPTTGAEHLGKKIVDNGDDKDITVLFLDKNKDGKRHFPDGETYVRLDAIDKIKNDRIVILHSGMPNPDSSLTELEMLLGILRDADVKNVQIFFSYFPYGMQDEIFEKGEINVAEHLVQKLIKYYQVKKIYVLDAHFFKKEWTFFCPMVNISALPLLKETVLQRYPDIMFVAPDDGSQKRNELEGVSKKRENSFEIQIHHNETFASVVKGKTIAVVDDIIETGGTMDRFYDKCLEYGAKELVALVTHGVLPSGIEKIKSKYSNLYLTNSIDRPESNVDVSKIIIDTLATSVSESENK